jgi:hypothetical protein
MKKHLSSLIKEATGMSIKEFCTQVLHTEYPNFIYRVGVGKIHVKEYLIISEVTGHSLDKLIAEDPRYAEMMKEAQKISKETRKVYTKLAVSNPAAPKSKSTFKYVDV